MTQREQLIRERAYAIWEAEGCPSGREIDHWRQAALEVDEVMAETPAAAGAAPSEAGSADFASPAEIAPGAPVPAPRRGRRKAAEAPQAPEPAAAAEVPPAPARTRRTKAAASVVEAPDPAMDVPSVAPAARGRRKKAE